MYSYPRDYGKENLRDPDNTEKVGVEYEAETTAIEDPSVGDLQGDLPEGYRYNSPYDDEINFFALCRGEKILVCTRT